MNQRSLILLRGLPGSGKSALAEVLSENKKFPVFSVDNYFTNAQTGKYFFNHQENHLAYKQCEAQTRKCLIEGIEKVFVDNTFTIDWEMEPYFRMASDYGYRIFVVTVENRHGSENVHGISREQLEKMASKYSVKLM